MSTYFAENPQIARPDGAGTVSSGSILVFASNVSSTQKSDVTNSILFAQLAADKKYDRNSNTVEWYGEFKNVLRNIGWVCGNFNFNQVSLGNSPSADQVVMDCMTAGLESSETKAVQTAVDAVKNMPDGDKALKIFKEKSSFNRDANFQVAYCKDSDGNVTVGLGAFVYHISRSIENPLTSTLESDSASASSCFQPMILDEYVYGRVRKLVKEKLGSYVKELVEDF